MSWDDACLAFASGAARVEFDRSVVVGIYANEHEELCRVSKCTLRIGLDERTGDGLIGELILLLTSPDHLEGLREIVSALGASALPIPLFHSEAEWVAALKARAAAG